MLFNITCLNLITPHSNAGIERVLALVRNSKSKRCNRNIQDVKRSLSSVLAVKLDQLESVNKYSDYNLEKDISNAAKKATANA